MANISSKTKIFLLAIISVFFIFNSSVFAEEDFNIESNRRINDSFWEFPDQTSVKVVEEDETLILPNINYQGVYKKNVSGSLRDVIRISFNADINGGTDDWHRLLLFLPENIDDQIDWENSNAYKGAYPNHKHDYPGYNQVEKFLEVDKSHVIDLGENISNKDLIGRIEIPIDLVLKESVNINELTDFVLQFRITDKDYKKVYSRYKNGGQNYYQDYTFASNIDLSDNYLVNTSFDVRNLSRSNEFRSNLIYADYNESEGYIDIINKYSKEFSDIKISQKSKAFRQAMDIEFFNMLKSKDDDTVAEITILSSEEEVEDQAETLYLKADDFNLEDSIAYFQAGPESFNDENLNHKTIKIDNKKFNKILLNAKETDGSQGLATRIRYYIDKEKFNNYLDNNQALPLKFHTCLVSDYFIPNEVFTITARKDMQLKKGDFVNLWFGEDQRFSAQELIIKSGDHEISFADSIERDEGEYSRTESAKWNVPFDMYIKEGDQISLKTQPLSEGFSGGSLRFQFPFDSIIDGVDQDAKYYLSKANSVDINPRLLPWSSSYSSIVLAKTKFKPTLGEIFTDGKLKGYSYYKDADISIKYGNQDRIETNSSDQARKIIVGGEEKTAFDFTYELNGLEKDSAIYIVNRDKINGKLMSNYEKAPIQVKLKFDLNGGSIGIEDEISFEGVDDSEPIKDFNYILNRKSEFDPIIRILPRNINYKEDSAYIENGFSGQGVSYLDHKGRKLEGQALELRQFVETKAEKEGYSFLGWSTKKIAGTDEEILEIWEQIEEAENVDQVNDINRAYKFTENSPISKEMTVYAVYAREDENLEINKTEKIAVTDPNKLTDIEKDAVENAIRSANPKIALDAEIIVDDFGRAEIIYRDQVIIFEPYETIIFAEKPVSTDKTHLADEISKEDVVKSSDSYKYADSNLRDNYDIAIEFAKAILNNEEASQKEIDEALKKIILAKDALVNYENINRDNSNSNIVKVGPSFIEEASMEISEDEIVEDVRIHKAYIKGYADGSIRADDNITRAETAAMIARLKAFDLGNIKRPDFKDLDNSWYNPVINAVVENGIMKGYEDGTFKPDQAISRAEFAEIIGSIDIKNKSNSPFMDIRGHWAEDSINQAYANKRIIGYEDGSFRPENKITRAEAAKILNSVFGRTFDKNMFEENVAIKRFADLNKEHWAYYELLAAANDLKLKEK